MKFNSVFFVCAIAYVANLSAAEDLPVARALAPYFEAVANVANLNQQAVAVQDPVAVAAPEALQAENDDVDMGLPNQENNQNDAAVIVPYNRPPTILSLRLKIARLMSL